MHTRVHKKQQSDGSDVKMVNRPASSYPFFREFVWCAPPSPQFYFRWILLSRHAFRTKPKMTSWLFASQYLIVSDSLYSDPPKMEHLPGAASHGRKLRKSKGRALEASTVQYCDKWGYILIQVGATSWDLCTKILIYIEGYNLPLRGISLRSTIRKLELHGFLWSGCPLLNFISKKSNIKELHGSWNYDYLTL